MADVAADRPGAAAWRLWAACALLLGVLTVYATERYAVSYETLPTVDWLEAHPPLDESGSTPSAYDFAQRFAAANPELSYRAPIIPWSPQFAPPSIFELDMAGVRDAAMSDFASANVAAQPTEEYVTAQLKVAVYHRAARAAAWVGLESVEFDLHDGGDVRAARYRLSGPDEADRVWVARPDEPGAGWGGAMIVGQRGVMAFLVNVRVERPSQRTFEIKPDLTARAEVVARQLVRRWSARLDASR